MCTKFLHHICYKVIPYCSSLVDSFSTFLCMWIIVCWQKNLSLISCLHKKITLTFSSFSPKHSSNISGSSRSSYGYQKQRNINSNESQVGLHSDPSSNHNRLSWPQFRNTSTSSPQQRNEKEFSSIREAPPSPVCDNMSPMISLATGVQESTRARRDSLNRQQGALERVLCPDEAKVLERANQIVMYVMFLFLIGAMVEEICILQHALVEGLGET